jgi:hypothetical protein
MSAFSDAEKEAFEAEVQRYFGFLQSDEGMKRGSVYASGGSDPRDAGLVVRFSRQGLMIGIAWKENEKALVLSIYFDRDDLSPRERHVYFEPFVEYLTGGGEKAIIPLFEHGIGFATVLKQRERAFARGLPAVMAALGDKLKAHFPTLENTNADTIRRYHAK